ncbi:MAG: DMT family transporter [Candidatus Levybacteria bacterium]|nr:DMT family transporter [Candidatus Levybacteria bacterium]
MQQELTIAILGGLGTMLGWGFADFAAKRTVDGVGSIASLVWGHIFGTIVLFSVILFYLFGLNTPLDVPQGLTSWLWLIFFGTLQTIVYWLFYSGLEKGKASLLAPIFSAYSGIVAVISLLVFSETIRSNGLLALATIFGGMLLLNIDVEALRAKRLSLTTIPGFKHVFAATLLAAIWLLGWDKFVKGMDWLSYTFFMYAFMTLSAVVIAKIQKADLRVFKKEVWYYLVLIGIGESLAYTALSIGFSASSFTSVVAVIAGASALPTIILARIFLKERITKLQLFASLVIIIGVIILAI